jgi:hypothetical protein
MDRPCVPDDSGVSNAVSLPRPVESAAGVLAILAAFAGVHRFRLSQREHRRQLAVDQISQHLAVALLQRQLDADQAARDDAIARQITDLSAKASEQLGSDKAAVRIGGLTDLERLAQAYADLRQTVVDRICAYLRGPYEPPTGRFRRTLGQAQSDEQDSSNIAGAAGRGDAPTDEQVAARRLELDVRRTAQQILKRHLTWPADQEERPAGFWDGISLDLRDAVLIELDLAECRAVRVDLRNADFRGDARFDDATFSEHAVFDDATFGGDAVFDHAAFGGDAVFGHAAFGGDAVFDDTTFNGNVVFGGATFGGDAGFGGATFNGYAVFSGAAFGGDAVFGDAAFNGNAWFREATFSGDAWFGGAAFSGDAGFREATFSGDAWFGGAAFGGDAGFREATFIAATDFAGSRVSHIGANHVWARGWRVEPDPDAPGASGRLVRVFRLDSVPSPMGRAREDLNLRPSD